MHFISAPNSTSLQRRHHDGKRLLQWVCRLTAHLQIRLRLIMIYGKTANLVKDCKQLQTKESGIAWTWLYCWSIAIMRN
ncbi:hypothetical protein T07_9805 [Trichinella nelsoni]|uniref:Uncharacterized protein n=1 Tax=Trichinella nelsoni TaxID=6336 RepID=A0A0V0RPE7_9BILA|nr:hypothetical protein T07_9805 [Trichinella nelsoni]